ncbi:MAG: hypothetical protein RLZZ631_85 [Cyanobacteriota bacterium]|jgi:hypothetical protein
MAIITPVVACPIEAAMLDPELLADGAAALAPSVRRTALSTDPEDRTPDALAYLLAHVAAMPIAPATVTTLNAAADRLADLMRAREALDAATLALSCAMEAEPA